MRRGFLGAAAILAGFLLFEALVRCFPGFLHGRLSGLMAEFVSQKVIRRRLLLPDPELGLVLRAPAEIRLPRFPRSRIRHVPYPGEPSIGRRADFQENSKAPVAVAALGDSHVYQLEVDQDETWISRLARLTQLRTVNLGLPYQGTAQERLLYERYGARYRPRILLMTICPNDAWDNRTYREWLKEARRGGSRGLLAIKQCDVAGLSRAPCAVFRFVRSSSFLAFALVPSPAEHSKEVSHAALREAGGLSSIEDDIADLKKEADTGGTRFAVVLTDLWGHPLHRKKHAELLAFLKARRIDCLDLASVFAELGAKGDALHLSDRTHWSPEGSDYVARRVLDFLRARRWL